MRMFFQIVYIVRQTTRREVHLILLIVLQGVKYALGGIVYIIGRLKIVRGKENEK